MAKTPSKGGLRKQKSASIVREQRQLPVSKLITTIVGLVVAGAMFFTWSTTEMAVIEGRAVLMSSIVALLAAIHSFTVYIGLDVFGQEGHTFDMSGGGDGD